ncbi:MAG: diaminopimelate decarboxylase [Gammaproteobacteria bacterium]|nr:diaminopimelate decarboxylase [Gammaproteobacteria bacterium]MCP5425641.1 diaminopimelate decarboxylase [Gammaproteobacteria bacterium]MCP5458961.1 diaminopimelate decarboxylase [Gammaproteobacteria bacterium]
MDHFEYRNGRLCAEDVEVSAIAQAYGTPCYIYSRATIERHWRAFDNAFGDHPHRVCYAVKANSNLAVLNVMARLGSGFDIVSVGELERVLAAGGDPGKVVFSGVAKRRDEISRALQVGISCFNVESDSELRTLDEIAGRLGKRAPVSLRVNPDVDPETHPYISTGLKDNKFGIAIQDAPALYGEAATLPHIEVVGVDCHIGSQLTRLDPFVDALTRVLELVRQLEVRGVRIRHLDVGGGLGIRYRDETPPLPAEQAAALLGVLQGLPYEIVIEPGRAIVGNAGILVTRVELLKHNEHKNFAVVDAAMNDMLRPALYSAYLNVIPVQPRDDGEARLYDVVGPVCETGDFLGKQRDLNLQPGDLLAVRSAGAYGMAMSSNYNTRPRAAEVMVDGSRVHLIRRRETLAELYAGESLLP